MAKFWKRGVALTCAVCLSAAALGGCAKKAEAKAIYTFNDKEVDPALTNFLLRYQEAQFDDMYGDMFAQYYGGQNVWDMDMSGSGEPYSETFKAQFGTTLEQLLLAEEHASDYDAELTDEEKSKISAAADSFLSANDETVLNTMSASRAVVERALTLYTIQAKVEKGMTADVDTKVTDEEAAQRKVSYIEYIPQTETEASSESELSGTEAESENTAAAETETPVLASTEGETSPVQTESAVKTKSGDQSESETAAGADEAQALTEAESETETEDPAMAAAKASYKKMAEDELEKIKSGDMDFETAQSEAEDNAKGIYTSNMTFGADDTYPEKAIIQATNDLEDGTLVDQVIYASDSYWILHVDKKFDKDATEKKKTEIVKQRKTDQISKVYSGWEDKAEWKVDEDALAAVEFDRSYKAPATSETEASTETVSSTEAETSLQAVSSTEAETLTSVGTAITENSMTETEAQ